ncbi:hypothetical protein PG993_011689 [Apiospora rasikravindrae]|uniref:Uncharacterized protein n=1 Tax=Apiospora rasikravindrae TaxID=990691 RepID=A0ABR1S0H8_9PEZI
MLDEDSGPGLDVGFGIVPVGADVIVPFGRGKGAEVKAALPVVPDTPVEKIESVPKGVAVVVLAVGKGAWPELRIGDADVCIPVLRVTLLPGGIPCPVGPMISVVFEIGNGAGLESVPVGPPASPLLPVEATVGNGGVAEAPPTEEGTDPLPVTVLKVQVPETLTTGTVPPLGDALVPERPVEFDNGYGALSPVEDAGCLYAPDPVGATIVEPALGPAVGPVEFEMVKGGRAVEPIAPEAVFPVPPGPGAAKLEFEIGNGGTVCPAGLLPGALLPDPEDVVRLGADGAVVSPDPPVGPALGVVVFDKGNGGFDSEEVFSGVNGTEAPVLNGAVPEGPPVGATVWPPGPPVVLVRGNGAVDNVFTSDDNEGVVARTLEFEANVNALDSDGVPVSDWAVGEAVMDTDPVPVYDTEVPVGAADGVLVPLVIGNGAKEPDMMGLRVPEAIGPLVIGGPPGIPEMGVVEVILWLVACPPGELMTVPVEPPNVAVIFPVGKGGVIDDGTVPGGGLLKAVLEMTRLVEVEELNKPDVSVPSGDTVKDPEATTVVSLEDGTNEAVPVGTVKAVVLDNGNGGATVEVPISLPLPVTLGDPEVPLACGPVMVFDGKPVPRVLVVVILPKVDGVELEDNSVLLKSTEL